MTLSTLNATRAGRAVTGCEGLTPALASGSPFVSKHRNPSGALCPSGLCGSEGLKSWRRSRRHSYGGDPVTTDTYPVGTLGNARREGGIHPARRLFAIKRDCRSSANPILAPLGSWTPIHEGVAARRDGHSLPSTPAVQHRQASRRPVAHHGAAVVLNSTAKGGSYAEVRVDSGCNLLPPCLAGRMRHTGRARGMSRQHPSNRKHGGAIAKAGERRVLAGLARHLHGGRPTTNVLSVLSPLVTIGREAVKNLYRVVRIVTQTLGKRSLTPVTSAQQLEGSADYDPSQRHHSELLKVTAGNLDISSNTVTPRLTVRRGIGLLSVSIKKG